MSSECTNCGGAYDSVLVGPRLQDVATGGNWGLFYSAPHDFVVLGVFCARFPPRQASALSFPKLPGDVNESVTERLDD